MSSNAADFSKQKLELGLHKTEADHSDPDVSTGPTPLQENKNKVKPKPTKPYAIVQELPDWRNLL